MQVSKVKVLSVCLFAVLICAVSLSAYAAGRDAKYPAKPIKILILEGPGGTCDVPTRALARAVEKISASR